VLPVATQRHRYRPARCGGIAVGSEDHDGVVSERAAGRGYPPGMGICGICGICGTCGLLDGGETVTVLVLVLTDVLTDVLTLGSVVVVLVDGSVVVSVADDGGVVSVTVPDGATTGADVADVVAVVVVVVVVLSDESDIRLTANHTIRAIRSATSAPKPISAAGLRYQGTGGSGGSGGWPGCW
jgi:hypothetical protein